MIVPATYTIVGSCGVALLRRSGDLTPSVLGTPLGLKEVPYQQAKSQRWGFDSPTPHL
ncbi:hypothetical protein H6G32_12740 [Cylindrospermum sp. FACHB-282]|nr:hypothetical protein [Cylindrospermum sp. FACHB-282]